MDYEFKNAESLIRNAIASIINSRSAFKEQFAKISTTVSEVKTRAKRSFVLTALSFDQKQHVTRYVQFHQHSLIDFSDELAESTTGGDDPQLIEMISFFCDQLEDLLKFLQNQFPEHFNLDFKVSEFFKRKSLQSLGVVFDQISANGQKSQINQTLFTISIRPIQEFLTEIGSPISYRALTFTTELSDGIQSVIQSDQENPPKEERILLILLRLNYNSKACFDYYIDHLKTQLSETDAVSDQLEKLAFSHKVLNQTQIRQGLTYDFRSRPLKDQLSNWLLEEIQYLERKRELSSKSTFNEVEFVKTEFKLEFNMSVSQFAYFIKAFVESGVIQNKNTTELMRFLSKFVKSRRSEGIGYESFRSKYYNVENSTKDSVKNLLHTIIGYINSN